MCGFACYALLVIVAGPPSRASDADNASQSKDASGPAAQGTQLTVLLLARPCRQGQENSVLVPPQGCCLLIANKTLGALLLSSASGTLLSRGDTSIAQDLASHLIQHSLTSCCIASLWDDITQETQRAQSSWFDRCRTRSSSPATNPVYRTSSTVHTSATLFDPVRTAERNTSTRARTRVYFPGDQSATRTQKQHSKESLFPLVNPATRTVVLSRREPL